jgi:hypothetical protein
VVQIHSPRPFFQLLTSAPSAFVHTTVDNFVDEHAFRFDLSLAKILSALKIARSFLSTTRTESLHSTKNCFQECEGSFRRDIARECGVHTYEDGRKVRPY